MNKTKLLIITCIVVLAAAIGMTVLFLNEKQSKNELVQEFELEKEDLENEYTHFARQYDELKLTVSNDSLAVLLEQEQLKTQRLLEELRTVKSSNASEIRRLRKELASLRKIMVGYINQIDSLNRLTNQQREIIADVTQKYNAASRQITTLAEEKKDLNKKSDARRPTGRHQHQHTRRQQARQESPAGKGHREVQDRLYHREEHHRRDRRAHPVHTHHQTRQRRTLQEPRQHLCLREPRAGLLHQEIH